MKKFGIVAKKDEASIQVEQHLKEQLTEKGLVYDKTNPELILCVGGDGTFLYAVHKYLDILENCCFLAIHTGTLGFFTDYTQEEIDLFLDDIFHKFPCYEEMPLLEMKTSKNFDSIYALNEIRIESVSKTLSLDVYIDGEFFEHCTGSGICISTQAGSTAINRALQGAVIDDGLRVLQLCEIMPIAHKNHHSLHNPYIMRSDRQIMVRGKSLSLAA